MQVKEAMVYRDEIITALSSITVEEAMKILAINRVGSLILIGDDDKLDGIITSRDLLQAVATFGSKGLEKTLNEIMSVKLLVVHENDNIKIAIEKMEEFYTHHILVKDNSGEICGLLSSYDIVRECSMESIAF